MEEKIDDTSLEGLFESFDDVLSVQDTEYRTIRKAWGGRPCRIGSLTAQQMITFLENNDVPAQRRKNGLVLISQSLVDSKGKRLVDTSDPKAIEEAVNKLKNRDAATNGRIVESILDLNGLNKKDTKEIAKNVFAGTPTGDSPTV